MLETVSDRYSMPFYVEILNPPMFQANYRDEAELISKHSSCRYNYFEWQKSAEIKHVFKHTKYHEKHSPDLCHMMMAIPFPGLAILNANQICRLRFESKYFKLQHIQTKITCFDLFIYLNTMPFRLL